MGTLPMGQALAKMMMTDDDERQSGYAEKRRLQTIPNLDRHLLIYFVEPPPKNERADSE